MGMELCPVVAQKMESQRQSLGAQYARGALEVASSCFWGQVDLTTEAMPHHGKTGLCREGVGRS